MNLDDKYMDGSLKGRDIVIISLQPWYYELGSNCKNIATHFAKHNRVLYVNIPITRKTYLSRNKTPGIREHCTIIKEKGETIRKISENMWEFYPTTLIESINGLPSTTIFRFLNKINNRRFARDIKKALDSMNFTNIILFNDNDIYNGFYLKELLSPSLYIYYCRDFLQGFAYWKKHTSVLEPLLIKKADLVVANSIYYATYCSTFNKNSFYVGQGCNIELFDDTKDHPLPQEMKAISSPVIGYVGALDSGRLDKRIIELIAVSNPELSIILVGPEDSFFAESNLHQISNIHFLGRKRIEQLPGFVKAFDICINPQFVNDITRGNYPLKIDEYLAMGKPAVATRTEAMRIFEDLVYIADKPEDYPALIQLALSQDSELLRKKRIELARTHTWENSVKEIALAIEKTYSARENK